jgi:NADPH:quinone reductase-like Zn-dependent oxidoreductase
MKAIQLTAYGNPAQNLKMVEVSEPNALSANEALVRMEYAPIAYSDLLLANRVYLLNSKLPSVIGGEGAGIIGAIRPGVTNVKVGDRVTIPYLLAARWFCMVLHAQHCAARWLSGCIRITSARTFTEPE